ncbi:MAG: TraB/GumN family protein [Deltaproteobacteria bacterium]|nr:TraB/GumN family protein [Deltaproteobacteria bacterium]
MDENADLHRLTFDDKEITLIGTAHVSRESADLVERVISEEKPETVCVELCRSRYQAIIQKDKWQDTDLIKVIKEKKAFLLLSNLILSSFQKAIGKKLGIRPGEEMIRAISAAEGIGAHIHLADREIRTTLLRAWRRMRFRDKFRLFYQLLGSFGGMEDLTKEAVEEMKKKDILHMLLDEMGKSQPLLKEVLIDERDRYLSQMIKTAPGKSIVAVVGAGHVPGIMVSLYESTDLRPLDEVPPERKMAGVFKWGIPGLIVALFIGGFFFSGTAATMDMVRYWVFTTAIMSGIGAAASFAHPVTILSAALVAPITTIHPLIAAGWIAGLVEVFMGKPKVRDFEALPEDIMSVKGFWRNKITRVLLVVVFTNIGASLGTFLGISMLVKVFS